MKKKMMSPLETKKLNRKRMMKKKKLRLLKQKMLVK